MPEIPAEEVKSAAVAATIKMNPIHPDQLEDLKNRFMHHKPSTDQQYKYEVIRSSLFQGAHVILGLTPKSVEQTAAIRKLEEAMFWANAAIARNEQTQEGLEG